MMNSLAFWTSYRSVQMDSWGPLRVFGSTANPDEKPLAAGLQPFIADLLSRGIVPGDLKPGQQYEVNDAAEAALLLHLDHEISLIQGSPTVYRGQADHPNWTIQASVDRTRVAGQERGHLTQCYGAILFEYILKQIDWQAGKWMPKGWRLDEQPTMAMARHHGMASALIDVTVDPSVAVMFAQEQAAGAGTSRAKVFRFHVDSLGDDATFNVPPPPVLRSVRQHGVYFHSRFTNMSPVKPPLEQAAVVCFPTSSSGIREDGFCRDGKIVDLMHADPLLAAIEKHVRRCMAVMPVGAIHEEYLRSKPQLPKSLCQIGLFSLIMMAEEGLVGKEGSRFRYHPTADTIYEWFSLVTDIIHALCGIYYHQGHSYLRDDLLERFVRDNHVASQLYLYFFASIYRDTPLQSLLPIVRIMNAKLLKISDGSIGIYVPDFAPSSKGNL